MNYWLLKSDPETYGWPHLERDKKTDWTGVRNFQARKHLQNMRTGDLALFYHSQTDKAVVGVAKIIKEAYPDKTATEAHWVAVDIAPLKPFKNPVTLQQIKDEKSLSEIHLVRQARLSVMPLDKKHFDRICQMGETEI